MADKYQFYRELAEETELRIAGSFEDWTGFLKTAARVYKYTYPEQLMIYAQRPDATACAGYDVWNDRMHRYVRRGSKGIALFDAGTDILRLRYVFDVSDTGSRDDTKPVRLWQYRENYEEEVSASMERAFDVSGENGLNVQLEKQLRRQHHITQEKLAEALGITDAHLRRNESGSSVGSMELVIELADYFDTSLDYLLLGKNASTGKSRKDILLLAAELAEIAEELQ